MADQKKPTKDTKRSLLSSSGVGIVFLVAGIGLIIPEGSRAVGIPFLILGIVFIAMESQGSKAKK